MVEFSFFSGGNLSALAWMFEDFIDEDSPYLLRRDCVMAAALNANYHVLEWLSNKYGNEVLYAEIFLKACRSPRNKRIELLHYLMSRKCDLPSSYALHSVPEEAMHYVVAQGWLPAPPPLAESYHLAYIQLNPKYYPGYKPGNN